MRHTGSTCDCHSVMKLLNIPIILDGPIDTRSPLAGIFVFGEKQEKAPDRYANKATSGLQRKVPQVNNSSCVLKSFANEIYIPRAARTCHWVFYVKPIQQMTSAKFALWIIQGLGRRAISCPAKVETWSKINKPGMRHDGTRHTHSNLN